MRNRKNNCASIVLVHEGAGLSRRSKNPSSSSSSPEDPSSSSDSFATVRAPTMKPTSLLALLLCTHVVRQGEAWVSHMMGKQTTTSMQRGESGGCRESSSSSSASSALSATSSRREMIQRTASVGGFFWATSTTTTTLAVPPPAYAELDYSKIQDLLGADATAVYEPGPGKRPSYLTEPTSEFVENEKKAAAFRAINMQKKKTFLTQLDLMTTAPNDESTLTTALDEMRRQVKADNGLPIGITKEMVVKTCRRRKSLKYWPTNVEIAYVDSFIC
jgi:hypothetical protein